jgi:DNA adenine methylase
MADLTGRSLMTMYISPPHPFPYQGSKRKIAEQIIDKCDLSNIDCVIEPFAGTSAITLALLQNGFVEYAVINDKNAHIAGLWQKICSDPVELCDGYEQLWIDQQSDPKRFFLESREKLNTEYSPEIFLYILARIVKGAVRYSKKGVFTQSADNRRLGMNPKRMRQNILAVSKLISGRIEVHNLCYTDPDLYGRSGKSSLIYLDPPYQGVSFTNDTRYIDGVPYEEFVEYLNERFPANPNIVVSYDGMVGEKVYGRQLPTTLPFDHYFINAGTSSQETLVGRSSTTLESLYVSRSIARNESSETNLPASQMELLVA